jgi:hypothetical protein
MLRIAFGPGRRLERVRRPLDGRMRKRQGVDNSTLDF